MYSHTELIQKINKTEVWRWIPGYRNYYKASTWGRIKSVQRTSIYKDGRQKIIKERIMTIQKNKSLGYFYVVLWKNGKWRTFTVHSLILRTFVGPRPKGMQCRHFPDRTRTNNRLDNIQWGTALEDHQDKIACNTHIYTRGEHHGMSKLTEHQVKQIHKSMKQGKLTRRQMVLKYSTKFQMSKALIYLIVDKKRWAYLLDYT